MPEVSKGSEGLGSVPEVLAEPFPTVTLYFESILLYLENVHLYFESMLL